MKAPVVRLKIRVRLPERSRPYMDPVLTANGKLRPNYAIVHGVAGHYPDSVYHLRYLKQGRRVWEAVGTDAQFALPAKWLRKTFATMHHEAGVPARTIQRWLRHSSPDTTLRYLAASDDRSAKTRGQVNKTFSFLQAD